MVYGDLQIFDIVIFAAIAVFLVFRLRKVLGKRTGFEKKPNNKTGAQPPKSKETTINIIPEPAQVKVKVKGGVDIIANLDPEKDLELYVDYRDYDGQSLLVLAAEDSLFEIREIVPSKVNLVEQ